MATATIQLPVPPHGFDSSTPCALAYSNGVPKLLFDDTTIEACYWQFRLPQNYASALTAKIQYSMDTATTGSVYIGVAVMAVTPTDATNMDAESYDASGDNVGSDAAVPGTAGYMEEISLALAYADSAAAGDYVRIRMRTNATGTATGDMEVWAVSLEYTTT